MEIFSVYSPLLIPCSTPRYRAVCYRVQGVSPDTPALVETINDTGLKNHRRIPTLPPATKIPAHRHISGPVSHELSRDLAGPGVERWEMRRAIACEEQERRNGFHRTGNCVMAQSPANSSFSNETGFIPKSRPVFVDLPPHDLGLTKTDHCGRPVSEGRHQLAIAANSRDGKLLRGIRYCSWDSPDFQFPALSSHDVQVP